MDNPFQITRAADLNDEQINQLWVDPGNKLSRMLRPASPLPMIIFGGRGSGKTHLMRYHSYSLQRLVRSKQQIRHHVNDLKYLGIIFRCTGLHASRFSKKRIPAAQWHDLFGLHLELTLGQLLLSTAMEYIDDIGEQGSFDEARLVRSLRDLFSETSVAGIDSIGSFRSFLRFHQSDLDHQIGMASFNHSIIPKITVPHGRLIFGIPQRLAEHIPCLRELMFTLFVDEYEHFFEDLQKHVNTLVRERENPVTFKIGVRPHGMHTYQTWGGNEELKQDSDYERLNLDQVLRAAKAEYAEFARALCIQRIRFVCNGFPKGWTDATALDNLKGSFAACRPPEQLVADRLAKNSNSRPWLDALKTSLNANLDHLKCMGVRSSQDVELVLAKIECDRPLAEKASAFLLYRAWSKGLNLVDAAHTISESAARFCAGSPDSEHEALLRHFREDLRDQMLIDLKLDRQSNENGILTRYIGIERWIDMSDGIIRNFISILKSVYGWAIFNGERIYDDGGVSLASQIRGVEDASDWFIKDASVLEVDKVKVDSGLRRIAELLRQLRFSRKPPECSLCRFAVDLRVVSHDALAIMQAAEMWSLLIRDPDRRNKNPGETEAHYRINPLIAPNYNLPLGARGSIDLSPEEADAIFGSGNDKHFERILRRRLLRCNPPFETASKRGGKRASKLAKNRDLGDELPGL